MGVLARLLTSPDIGALYFLCVDASRLGVTVARLSLSNDVVVVVRFGVNGVGRTSFEFGFTDDIEVVSRMEASTSVP